MTCDDYLTPSEVETLKLVGAGLSTKQIADLRRLSTKTVEHHRGELCRKLKVDSPALLVRRAMELGVATFVPAPLTEHRIGARLYWIIPRLPATPAGEVVNNLSVSSA